MAFDCIRASHRTVSSRIFIAGMEAKTDYVIVPLIYSQNLTCCQHRKKPQRSQWHLSVSCSRFLALWLLHCSLQRRHGWFQCGMTVGSIRHPRLMALSAPSCCATHSQQLLLGRTHVYSLETRAGISHANLWVRRGSVLWLR